MMTPGYVDFNATSPLHSVAQTAMMGFLGHPSNASTVHRAGRLAEEALLTARSQVAQLIGVSPEWVCFTSGGTEANNAALKGLAWSKKTPGHLVMSAIEHDAVRETARFLEADRGWEISTLPVNAEGQVNWSTLSGQCPDVLSVMTANNETGVMQSIATARALLPEHTVIHTDAVQAFGKVPLQWSDMKVDLMSVSAHKIGGPQGVGALIRDPKIPLVPLLHGGGQEGGLRSGTENIAGIVGFGAVCDYLSENLVTHHAQMKSRREQFERSLKAKTRAQIIGENVERLPNTTLFALPGISGEMLVMTLDKVGFYATGGAACGSRKNAVSPVLTAMEVPLSVAESVCRVSIGPETTEETLLALTDAIQQVEKTWGGRHD